MGYRSQVRAVIYGDPDQLQAFITKAMLEGCSVFEHFKDDLRRYRSVLSTYDHQATLAARSENGDAEPQWKRTPIEVLDLKGDDWKWYDDYPDVKAWHALMDESQDFDLSFEFIRVGEEPTDIVQESHFGGDEDTGDRFLNVARSIEDDLHVEQELEITGAVRLCEGA